MCSKSCGTGDVMRMRTCTNPTPSNNGSGCEGVARETVTCHNGPCSGEYSVNAYSLLFNKHNVI